MEDYQLRHDIDRLRRFLDELEILYNDKLGETDGRTLKDVFDMYYDQSEVESKSAVLKDSLKTLSESLVAFNQSLITFNGDTEALADDLTSLSTNLDNFLGNLGDLEESLEEFDNELNGENGFISVLNHLQNQLWGKGDTYIDEHGVEQECDENHPSSDSLKGILNGLGESLQELQDGDTKLSYTLSQLSSKLSGFAGTLAQFKSTLQTEYGELYDAFDEKLIELIYEIATSNTAIDNHQSAINTVQNKLGSSDATDTSTVFGKLYNANQSITAVEDSAEDLTKTLYAGTNGTGSTSSPATGTVMKNLNTVKNTDVPALQNQIHGGNPQNPTSTSVMGRIDTVQGRIGDEQTPNTIRYQIKDIDNQINNEQTGVIKQIDDVNDAYTELGDNLSNVRNHLYVGTTVGANGTTADPYDGTVMRRLFDTEYLSHYIDLALAKVYNPSTIFSKILVVPETPTVQLINSYIEEYNITTNIDCCYDSSNRVFYIKRSNGWIATDFENIPEPHIAIILPISGIVPIDGNYIFSGDVSFDYYYVQETKTYFEFVEYTGEELGRRGTYNELSTAPQLFQHTQLYDAIAECFSPIGHTHSADEIMAHTHTIANITNLQSTLDSKANSSTTYTKSEVNSALSSKANTSHTHTISNITNLQTTLNNKAEKSSTYTKLQVDNALSSKADSSDTYTKTEVDSVLSSKANASTTYTKTQVDTALSSKADSSNTYTKTEIDTALSSKANSSDTYTKTQINTALNNKANKEWDVLYDGSMGTVRTDGNLVSVKIKTGSTAISSSDWTTMGELSRVGDGIPSQYYPKANVFSPYLNGVTVMINTNGQIKANRPAGQVNTSVEINTVYPVW